MKLLEGIRASLEKQCYLAGPLPYLRYSAATILLSMGVNIKVVQELLGHSDISITLGRYSHLLPSMQKDVMDKWDHAFRNESDMGQKES